MNENPWKNMTLEDARAYDERKETGPRRAEITVKRRILWNLIKKYLPTDRSVPILDLGGGTGVWAIPLAQEGYDVIIGDVSPGFLARAREKLDDLSLTHKVSLAEMDIRDLGRFQDGHFPLVLALGDPVSYCGDALEALTQIMRITAIDGVLIADVENRYSGAYGRRAETWEDVELVLKQGAAFWPGSDRGSPVRMFTPDELRALVQAAGWEVASMYPSDLLAAILDREVKDKILPNGDVSEETVGRWVDLEEHMRHDIHLLGSGYEIQFVARNTG